MLLINVIERNYAITNPDFQCRYIGSPCRNFDEARELVAAHCEHNHDISVDHYIDNGTFYMEIDRDTGELMKEYFVVGIKVPD